jgi:hypothetical protein
VTALCPQVGFLAALAHAERPFLVKMEKRAALLVLPCRNVGGGGGFARVPLISNDLDEIFEIVDRIRVMFNYRLIYETTATTGT